MNRLLEPRVQDVAVPSHCCRNVSALLIGAGHSGLAQPEKKGPGAQRSLLAVWRMGIHHHRATIGFTKNSLLGEKYEPYFRGTSLLLGDNFSC